jgi:xylose dehydrogenase (NAD/NADP)
MSQTIRWGLLSTAAINEKLIPAIRQAGGHELVAVASRDQARAEAYATKWGIPKAFGSYEAMLSGAEVDAVYISLPNHLHVEWAVRAAEHGKHVLCEKPIALDPQGVDQVMAAAKKYNVVIMEAFMYRHHPRTLKLQEMLASGEYGAPENVYGHFNFMLDREIDIRWQPEAGGGALWDVGCYPVSYACMVMGEAPLEVFGVSKKTSQGVDIAFSGLLSFSGGRSAQIFSSFDLPYSIEAVILTDKGTLHNASPFGPDPDRPLLWKADGKNTAIETSYPYLYSGEVENMGDAILGKAQPRLSLQESRDINRVLSALYESATRQEPVRLD